MPSTVAVFSPPAAAKMSNPVRTVWPSTSMSNTRLPAVLLAAARSAKCSRRSTVVAALVGSV